MTAGELKDYCNGQVRHVYQFSWPSVTDSQDFHRHIFTSKPIRCIFSRVLSTCIEKYQNVCELNP